MPAAVRRPYPDSVRSTLLDAAAARRTQLDALPPAEGVVAVAHRRSIERILLDIHDAVDRLDRGTFGDCLRCGDRLPLVDVLDLPWITRCEPCASL